MNRKGIVGNTLLNIILILALLSLIFFVIFPMIETSTASTHSAAECGGALDGLCQTSCDAGYMESTPQSKSCSGSKVCCIPDDIPDWKHRQNKALINFVEALDFCYVNTDRSFCVTAEQSIEDLIPEDSEFSILIEKTSRGASVKLQDDGQSLVTTSISVPFCADKAFDTIELYFEGGQIVYTTDSSSAKQFGGFELSGKGFNSQSNKKLCLENE